MISKFATANSSVRDTRFNFLCVHIRTFHALWLIQNAFLDSTFFLELLNMFYKQILKRMETIEPKVEIRDNSIFFFSIYCHIHLISISI